MAAAAISHLRRGAQHHALLYLVRRHFSSSSPLAAAARRLLSTSVDSGTSATGESYKPPPFDPFRAALTPASPPLDSTPVEEPPATLPLPEEASAVALPVQDPVSLQNEELEGLKVGLPSAIAFLLKGESEIVKNFLLHTLQLQVTGPSGQKGGQMVVAGQ